MINFDLSIIFKSTQALHEKGWFDITAYFKNTGPYNTATGGTSIAGTAAGAAIEAQLFASGLTNAAALTAVVTAGEAGDPTQSPFLNANTGNTAYGIQYSSQVGNNGNQRETFPATNGFMAFFIVKFDAGNRLTIYTYFSVNDFGH